MRLSRVFLVLWIALNALPLTLHAQLRPVAPVTQPEAPGGRVEILTVPGAEIVLDSKLRAKADGKGRAEFRGVKAGDHEVEVFSEGHNTEGKSFTSSTTEMTTVTADLKAVIRIVSKSDFDTPKFVQERSLEAGYLIGGECSMAFSEDGRLLAAAGNSDLKVWDTDTGRELRNFEVRSEVARWIETVTFAPDASTLALREAQTGDVQIWSMATGKRVRTISSCHGKGIPATPAFSKDGLQMAWACSDGIPIVEAATGKELRRLSLSGRHDSHRGGVGIISVQFSADGKSLLAGTIGLTQVWDLTTGEVTRSFEYSGTHSAFNQDGSWVAFAGPDTDPKTGGLWSLRLREVATGNEGYTHELYSGENRRGPVRFSPHGRWVFAGNDIWDTNTGRLAGSIIKGSSDNSCSPAIAQNWSRTARVDGDSRSIKILRRQEGAKPPAAK